MNIETTLLEIRAAVYAILGFMVVFVTAFVGWTSMVNKMRGGGTPMPPVNVFQLLGVMLGRLVATPKRIVYRATTRKLKNMGDVKPTPDVMPQLEKNFAAWIKKRANSEAGLDFREKSLERLMSEFGCPNLNTLRTLLQRFEGLGILEKRGSAGNSTRKLARGGYTKLCNLLPVSTSPTTKTGEKGGKKVSEVRK